MPIVSVHFRSLYLPDCRGVMVRDRAIELMLLVTMPPAHRQRYSPSVCPFVCLSHAQAQKRCIWGHGYYRTLIGNPMLEVEHTGECGCMASGCGRNSGAIVSPSSGLCLVSLGSRTGSDVRDYVSRYSWHSAGSLGWPFPMLKYRYISNKIYGSNLVKRQSETVMV